MGSTAGARGRDVAIIDTAGRLHTQTNLMAELEKVRRVVAAKLDGAPHETLLVVDATTGQNGLQQARLFGDTVGVTGVALTKLDGSARGGVAIAIAVERGLPVKLVGVGEEVDNPLPLPAAFPPTRPHLPPPFPQPSLTSRRLSPNPPSLPAAHPPTLPLPQRACG